ncbi:MAG: membrane protein insertion efficiency factor YidD [Patescibacteria group bacterium]
MNQLSLVSTIELYQRLVSPDHGGLRFLHRSGYCKYYPSCSEYGKHAILKYGSFVGLAKTAVRIIRCNPWSKGGIDYLL